MLRNQVYCILQVDIKLNKICDETHNKMNSTLLSDYRTLCFFFLISLLYNIYLSQFVRLNV